MKSQNEIEKLLAAAAKLVNKAIREKMAIKSYDPDKAQRINGLNQLILTAGTTVSILSMILNDEPLTNEDVRYFLSQCG